MMFLLDFVVRAGKLISYVKGYVIYVLSKDKMKA